MNKSQSEFALSLVFAPKTLAIHHNKKWIDVFYDTNDLGKHLSGVPGLTKACLWDAMSRMLTREVKSHAPALLKDCRGYLEVFAPMPDVQSEQKKQKKMSDAQKFFKKDTFFTDAQAGDSQKNEFGYLSVEDEVDDYFRILRTPSFYKENDTALSVLHRLSAMRKCPRIVHVGLRFLGLPSTNVKSESNWSKASITTNGRRNRLDPDNCHEQLFVN